MQEQGGPRPFDVATRRLIESDPAGWLAMVGLPVDGPVRALDSDVSTVLAEVDKVLRVDAAEPWLAHLEIQASHDRTLPRRLLQYYALLLHRHELPVASIVVLLRPEADGAEMSGRFEQRSPAGDLAVSFNFGVVRIWERPVDELLRGALSTLPLAPVSDVDPARLPDVIRRMEERLNAEVSADLADDMWSATYLLMGLRYDRSDARELLRGVLSRMRESSTYQAILEEGREEGLALGEARGRANEARRLLVRLGTRKLGAPDASVTAALDAIDDPETLEQLADRLFVAESWADLLSASDPA